MFVNAAKKARSTCPSRYNSRACVSVVSLRNLFSIRAMWQRKRRHIFVNEAILCFFFRIARIPLASTATDIIHRVFAECVVFAL